MAFVTFLNNILTELNDNHKHYFIVCYKLIKQLFFDIQAKLFKCAYLELFYKYRRYTDESYLYQALLQSALDHFLVFFFYFFFFTPFS